MTDNSMAVTIDWPAITAFLHAELPDLLALYLFGSHVKSTADTYSDVDLAFLVDGKVDAVALWKLSQQLADKFAFDVDLVDLRATSTVMQ